MLKRMVLSGLVGCAVLMGAAGARADIPDAPDGAVAVHVETDYDGDADVKIWQDTAGKMYIEYTPTTLGFGVYNFLWDASQNGVICSMYNKDEYGFTVSKSVYEATTFSFVPSLTYCQIDFDEPFTLLFHDEDVFQYPADFGGTDPVDPVCTCNDTDSDGVPDAWDQCANTPTESIIDATGCPQTLNMDDSDKDGVPDTWDQCAETPSGSLVDALGCPGTSPVEDGDGDGVPDTLDQCADTPAGSLVDATGCPGTLQLDDSDNDGVPDTLDQCADTPAGSLVDSTGCPGTSQIDDSDGDGVPDTWDQCADTPSGSATDATGCPVAAPEAETIILPIVISK